MQKKEESSITFKLQVFCTTKLYHSIQLEFSTVPFRIGNSTENQQEDEQEPSGGLFCCKPKKQAPIQWSQYVGLVIESKDSASIDYDNLNHSEFKGNFAEGIFNDKKVFIQKLLIEEKEEELRKSIVRRVNILHSHDCPTIVQYYGSTHIATQPFTVVMEKAIGISLKKFIQSETLSDKFKAKLALQVASSLEYLHQLKISHKYVKAKNFIVVQTQLGDKINIKTINTNLIDTSTSSASSKEGPNPTYSKVMAGPSSNKGIYDKIGSMESKADAKKIMRKGLAVLSYLSPESMGTSSNIDMFKVDVYAFAILLWEIYAQQKAFTEPKFYSMQTAERVEFVKGGQRMTIPKKTPKDIVVLIHSCWNQDANSRPSFSEIVAILKKEFETASSEVPPAIPKQPTKQDLAAIGWIGDMSREEAENKLYGTI